MKPRVYLETSFISYLTSPLSRDIITAANQHITREWWKTRRLAFELFISPFVIACATNTKEPKELPIV